jgi:hypothetical protein
MSKVAIIDTSLLGCWLQIPGLRTAGSEPDLWDFERTESEIRRVIDDGCQLVFPIATLVETGNHAAKAAHGRREAALRIAEKLSEALHGAKPWTSFSDQFGTLGFDSLKDVCLKWPDRAAEKVSIGDHLISSVADYYGRAGFDVEILSSDAVLRAHVPARAEKIPRRRAIMRR